MKQGPAVDFDEHFGPAVGTEDGDPGAFETRILRGTTILEAVQESSLLSAEPFTVVVEACASALVRYAQGGSMIYEEVGYHPRPSWLNVGTHLVFSEGVVGWDEEHWRLCTRAGDEVVEPLPEAPPAYGPVYANLASAIAGEPYRPRAWELAVDTAIAQGAYASAREGAEIDLSTAPWRIDH